MLFACTDHSSNKAQQTPRNNTAARVVSLDVCADQYALELLPAAHIAALSPDAVSDFSYHQDKARTHKTVRPRAEDILALKPDIVLRAHGGGPNAARLFEAAGIDVVNIGWVNTLEGDAQGSVIDTLRTVAQDLNQAPVGERLITQYEQRLTALKDSRTTASQTALYVTPYGATTGTDSLIHDLIELGGYENYQKGRGWASLPLERLTQDEPDIILTSFFDSHDSVSAHWSPSRHPIIRRMMDERPSVDLKGAWTSCNAWFVLDVAEAIQSARLKAARLEAAHLESARLGRTKSPQGLIQ